MSAAAERVQQHWGDNAPEWVHVLAIECKRASQKRIADQVGYSPSVISQVLKNIYTGDLTAVEKAVSGALMNTTVSCPVLGDLPGNRCLEHQRQKFSATSSQRVRLYQACRSGCPHYKQQGEQS